MSSKPFLSSILVTSSVMCMLMNSWLTIWILLEMNTLAFCCMMKIFSKGKKNSTESSMKYFIIQSVASSLLIFSSSITNIMKSVAVTLFTLSTFSLFIKMAATPFHQWFINLMSKMKWKNATILLTWQKFAPVFLLIYQIKVMVFPFVIMSAIVGSLSQMNKVKIMEIMGFSSIFNLSWMMLAILMNTKSLILFSLIYWTSVILAMFTIYLSKMKYINSESSSKIKKWMYFMVIINLAGIPPMAGFLSKWIIFSEGITNKMNFLVTSLLVSSAINLYIYMRMTNFMTMKNTEKKQKMNTQTKKMMTMNIILLSITPLGIISL